MDTFKKDVAMTQEADEKFVNEIFLSDEDASHFGTNGAYPGARLGDLFLKFLRIHLQRTLTNSRVVEKEKAEIEY